MQSLRGPSSSKETVLFVDCHERLAYSFVVVYVVTCRKCWPEKQRLNRFAFIYSCGRCLLWGNATKAPARCTSSNQSLPGAYEIFAEKNTMIYMIQKQILLDNPRVR
jgi:hypothetical protein